MPDRPVRVGTRASRLALWQTEHVIARLGAAWPDARFERVPIRTLGDRVTDVPLSRIGDRGLFTREIEDGLRAGTIDIAVHSLKDLPTDPVDGLALGAVLDREDPREALISRDGRTLGQLPSGARVGTSSLRRRSQVLAIRSDLAIVDIRGNVPTRIEKVERGDYDATLLARAGLRRLELTDRVSEVFDADVIVPAPGQGALAVQIRAEDPRTHALVHAIDHAPTRVATAAERALLAFLEGGCQAPMGALASWDAPGRLRLLGVVASVTGSRVIRAVEHAPVAAEADALELAAVVGARLQAEGAAELMREARRHVAELAGAAEEA
jgi:hydroxymethylbilane synthase